MTERLSFSLQLVNEQQQQQPYPSDSFISAISVCFLYYIYTYMVLLLLLGYSVVSDSVRPHRWLPTSLLCPWDFPGKRTGVGVPSPSPYTYINVYNY